MRVALPAVEKSAPCEPELTKSKQVELGLGAGVLFTLKSQRFVAAEVSANGLTMFVAMTQTNPIIPTRVIQTP